MKTMNEGKGAGGHLFYSEMRQSSSSFLVHQLPDATV